MICYFTDVVIQTVKTEKQIYLARVPQQHKRDDDPHHVGENKEHPQENGITGVERGTSDEPFGGKCHPSAIQFADTD